MKKNASLYGLIFVLLLTFAACGDPEKPDTNLPDDAYSFASDPLPHDAIWVPADAYEKIRTQPGFLEDNQITREEDLEALEEQEEMDERVIHYEENARGKTFMPPEPEMGNQLEWRNDGTYGYSIPIDSKDGPAASILTMNWAWEKHAVANSIRNFDKRENHLSWYEKIYAQLTEEERKDYELIAPETLRKSPSPYSDRNILDLNRTLATNWKKIARAHFVDPTPQVTLPNCNAEVGGSSYQKYEQHGTDMYLGTCAFSSKGLFANYGFPLQKYLSCTKDQRKRGSCASFGVAAGIELEAKKKYNSSIPNLSEQILYNKYKMDWAPSNYSEGAWVVEMLDSMKSQQWKLPYEYQWPYNPSPSRVEHKSGEEVYGYAHSCDKYKETCSDTVHQSQAYCTTVGDHNYCGYSTPEKNPTNTGYRVLGHNSLWNPNETDFSTGMILLSVIFDSPVIVSFGVTTNFAHPISGFVKFASNEDNLGGHVGLIVGFLGNDQIKALNINAPDSGDEGYFILKNSWSGCWGDGGYAYLPVSYIKAYAYEAFVLSGVEY